jgi:hypothetical protein
MSQLRELFRLIGMLRRQMWSEYLDESRDGKRQPIQL